VSDRTSILFLNSDGFARAFPELKRTEPLAAFTRPITAAAPLGPDRVAVATAVGAIDIVEVASGHRRRLTGHTGHVNCVAANGYFLVSGGADTFTNCWRIGPWTHTRVPSFRGEILCVAVSSNFRMAIAGTRDGALLWIVPETGAIARVVQLDPGELPKRVMVTDAWGFVVVHTQAVVDGEARFALAVYTVNGERIRARALERGIAAWTSWRCAKGFDHALIVDDAGCIFRCEVFWLDIAQPIDVCAPPDSISFVREDNVYIIVSKDGSVRIKTLPGECCPDGLIGGEENCDLIGLPENRRCDGPRNTWRF
jgi:WD40 repeat protein